MSSKYDLDGRHIVITGASGRLGSRLTEAFAVSRAKVTAIVRERASADVELDDDQVFEADLTDAASADRAFASIEERHGPIDALVHTVGTWAETPLLTASVDDWWRVIGINLKSTYLAFRAAAERMNRGGRLIAFASQQGADRGTAGQSAYSAAKGAVVRLVESVDAELSGQGIRAYAVAPSFINYDGQGKGVTADFLVSVCAHLCVNDTDALGGSVIRAYG